MKKTTTRKNKKVDDGSQKLKRVIYFQLIHLRGQERYSVSSFDNVSHDHQSENNNSVT